MKNYLRLTILFLTIALILFNTSCCKCPEVIPVDPNLGKALVLDFKYTFKANNLATVLPKFDNKPWEEYYKLQEDAAFFYIKTKRGSLSDVITPLPNEIDSIRYDIIVEEIPPINSTIFPYALKKSSNPKNYHWRYPGYEYAFGSKDSTVEFRAVIIKGYKGSSQSNARIAATKALDYNFLMKKYQFEFIK